MPIPDDTTFLSDVAFADANTGVAVGAGGTIIRTTDGGATWVSKGIGTTMGLYEIDFVDANNGFI